ncbi:MAG: hypothetical protein Kow0092_08190 [Deferrisomatales bacterium]
MLRKILFLLLLSISWLCGTTINDVALAANQKEATVAAAHAININTATVEELTSLKGVGEKTAEAIVRYRLEHGPFQRMEDLLKVKGIGRKRLEALQPKISVQ